MNLANLVYVEETRLGYNIRLSSVKGEGYSQALQWIPKQYGENLDRYSAVNTAQHFLNNLLDIIEEMLPGEEEIPAYKVKLIKEDTKLDAEPNFKDYSDWNI